MRKVYGQSKNDDCPFCGKRAISKNKQGIPVCKEHTDKYLDIKCVCGEYLEVKTGKFGAYFRCMNCGNISMAKALSMR